MRSLSTQELEIVSGGNECEAAAVNVIPATAVGGAAVGAAACSPAGPVASLVGGGEAATAIDAETTALVQRVVREFADDSGATVSNLKAHDTIVCGTTKIEGRTTGFYVDLEDEEAFFAASGDYQDTMVGVACR